MRYSIVCASVNEETLQSCLLASPDIDKHQVIVKRGYRSVCKAYNIATIECTEDLIIYVHEDVYLPEGFFNQLTESLKGLEAEVSPLLRRGVHPRPLSHLGLERVPRDRLFSEVYYLKVAVDVAFWPPLDRLSQRASGSSSEPSAMNAIQQFLI